MLTYRTAVWLALALPLPAQVTSDPVFQTVSNFGVYGTNQGALQYQAWYSGNQTLSLDQFHKRDIGSFNNNGYVSLSCYRNNGFPRTSISTYCNCPLGGIVPYRRGIYTSNGSFNNWSNTPVSAQVTYHDAPGRRAVIQLGGRVSIQGSNTSGWIRCDVGNDGSWDFTLSSNGSYTTRNVPITLPASGSITIRFESFGSCTNDTKDRRFVSCDMTATYAYPPQTKPTITNYGATCGGTLTGAVDTSAPVEHRFSATLSGAPIMRPGMMLIGFSKVDVPLPLSTTCRLLVGSSFMVPFYTDLTGSVTRNFPPLSKYLPLRFYMQDVWWASGSELTSSNGIDVEFKL